MELFVILLMFVAGRAMMNPMAAQKPGEMHVRPTRSAGHNQQMPLKLKTECHEYAKMLRGLKMQNPSEHRGLVLRKLAANHCVDGLQRKSSKIHDSMIKDLKKKFLQNPERYNTETKRERSEIGQLHKQLHVDPEQPEGNFIYVLYCGDPYKYVSDANGSQEWRCDDYREETSVFPCEYRNSLDAGWCKYGCNLRRRRSELVGKREKPLLPLRAMVTKDFGHLKFRDVLLVVESREFVKVLEDNKGKKTFVSKWDWKKHFVEVTEGLSQHEEEELSVIEKVLSKLEEELEDEHTCNPCNSDAETVSSDSGDGFLDEFMYG